MTDNGLILDLDADVTECGDTLTGSISWPGAGPAPRGVVVSMGFVTSGRGSKSDSGGPDAFSISTANSEVARFELSVPEMGPISFSGRTISVEWHVEVRAEPSASTDAATQAITVLPKGGLAMWATKTAPPPRPTAEPAE